MTSLKISFFLLCSISFMFISCGKTTVLPMADPDLEILPLQKDVYQVIHSFPWPANSLLIQTGRHSALLIDTPYTPDATEHLMEWGRQNLKIKDFAVINSHFHLDNCGGNSYLLEQGIPVYTSDLTSVLLEQKGSENLEQVLSWLTDGDQERFREGFQDLILVSGDRIFPIPLPGENYHLNLQGLDLQIIFPGEGHSTDNLAIFIPSKKLLFGGCLIKSLEQDNLGNLSDGNPQEYRASLERLRNYFQSRDEILILPGHGAAGSWDLIDHTERICP